MGLGYACRLSLAVHFGVKICGVVFGICFVLLSHHVVPCSTLCGQILSWITVQSAEITSWTYVRKGAVTQMGQQRFGCCCLALFLPDFRPCFWAHPHLRRCILQVSSVKRTKHLPPVKNAPWLGAFAVRLCGLLSFSTLFARADVGLLPQTTRFISIASHAG
jgi:hypothetical protein